VIRVYDAASNVIETHEHKGDLKGTVRLYFDWIVGQAKAALEKKNKKAA
jgi:hypothetical protein